MIIPNLSVIFDYINVTKYLQISYNETSNQINNIKCKFFFIVCIVIYFIIQPVCVAEI